MKQASFAILPKSRLIPTAMLATILIMAAENNFGMEQKNNHQTASEQEPRQLARELKLDDNQRAVMRARMQSNREQFRALHHKRDQARKKLEELLADTAADENSIREAGKRMAEINAEITMQQVESRMELRRTLTPGQYRRLQELRHNLRERHMHQRQDQRPHKSSASSSRRRKTERPE